MLYTNHSRMVMHTVGIATSWFEHNGQSLALMNNASITGGIMQRDSATLSTCSRLKSPFQQRTYLHHSQPHLKIGTGPGNEATSILASLKALCHAYMHPAL